MAHIHHDDLSELLRFSFGKSLSTTTFFARRADLKMSTLELAKMSSQRQWAAVKWPNLLFGLEQEALERALHHSLGEPAQAALWRQRHIPTLVAFALHTEHAEAIVNSLLGGGLVSSDRRRIEALASNIESSDLDLMAVSQSIDALTQHALADGATCL